MTRRALIIGAGVGGTAAAVGLLRTGWTVEVRERAAGPESSGAALGLWPTAVKALDRIGLGDAVRSAATGQTSGGILRPDGSRIASVDAEKLRRRTGEPVHLIARRDLARLLSAAVPAGVVRYGAEAVADEDTRAGWDVVVVADGVFSRSRSELFGPRSAPRYTGNTAWRGAARVPAGAASETWAPGARFGVTPYRDGVTNWYATLARPEGERAPGAELAQIRRAFGDWHAPIPQILAALTEDNVMRHDLYDLAPPLPSYVAGRVALIGDAAHAMTPDLGRGACEALVDAVTLADLLSTLDVTTALAGYDRARRRPTQRLAALSYRMSRVAGARRLIGLRDVAVRAALAVRRPERGWTVALRCGADDIDSEAWHIGTTRARNRPVIQASNGGAMTDNARVHPNARVHLEQSRVTNLTQLNAEYVSRINRALEQGRDNLARELAAEFDADRRHLPRP
jgi:2-polyprenyl-6-methoxyphenol hydroxylase-like FAD-dependent oxidoreductase